MQCLCWKNGQNSHFHSTVKAENEAGVDLVLIQPFLLYYVNHVALMLTSIFKHNFHKKRKRFVSKQDQLNSSFPVFV